MANLEIQFRKISSFNNIVSKKNIELENKLKSCVQKEKQIQGRHEKEKNIHEKIKERQNVDKLTLMKNKSIIQSDIQKLEKREKKRKEKRDIEERQNRRYKARKEKRWRRSYPHTAQSSLASRWWYW